jgi:addiction module HigA family antidote
MHNPAHPGQVLKELYLDPLGLTITQAAKGLRISRQALSNILNGHNRITPDMALRFEKAFGISRQTWLNMQQNYDLWHAEQEVDLSDVQVFVTSREEGI